MEKNNLGLWVTMLVTATLCVVVVSMVAAMLFGLFHDDVSNDHIFEVITPAFQTIVGGFIGLITGIRLGQNNDNQK
jgi:undecaprenyl pyrophosphate phosphatase UppP